MACAVLRYRYCLVGLLSCLAMVQAHAQNQPLALRWSAGLSMPPDVAVQAAPARTGDAWPTLLSRAALRAPASLGAQAGVLAGLAKWDQTRATAWMPRVDAAAGARHAVQTSQGDTVRSPSSELTLAATLPIWRGADRALSQAQSAEADQLAWQARRTRMSVAEQLSLAYLQACEAAEQGRLVQTQQALLEEQRYINERRLQAGVGTVLDVLETSTRVEQARAQAQDIATRLRSQGLLLEKFTGEPVALPAGLRADVPGVPQVVPPLDEALALAWQHNPARQAALAQQHVAQATLQARDAERWQPTLDAQASWQRNQQGTYTEAARTEQRSQTRSVGLQLNWPLYTGGFQDGRSREAAALLTQAQARLDEADAETTAVLRDAYQTLAGARQAIGVQQALQATATAAYEALRKAFAAGTRSNLDLLNAQQQIYAARQGLVSARINALAAQVTILAALDQLDGQHIAPLIPLVDHDTL